MARVRGTGHRSLFDRAPATVASCSFIVTEFDRQRCGASMADQQEDKPRPLSVTVVVMLLILFFKLAPMHISPVLHRNTSRTLMAGTHRNSLNKHAL